MKTNLFILLFLVVNFCYAQDVIVLKNGDEINAIVQEVGTEEVKYKKYGTDVPVYKVLIEDIFMIKYENGTKDVFDPAENETKIEPVKLVSSEGLFERGEVDAKMYYTCNKCVAGGTFLSTFVLGGLIGLIPAVIITSSEPKTINLNLPSNAMINSSAYMMGYSEQALRVKNKKVWSTFGIALGVRILIILTVVSNR